MDKEALVRQANTPANTSEGSYGRPSLKFLHPSQVAMIDEALCAIGEFGEVRLIVEKGGLRFVVTQRSIDARKWQPGNLSREA